ncbi:MAG: NAD(P)H-binding protein, partial [Dactylosporangium sp.]|nr:NAD(P)H-binding protein [Dactylosporangium sp.]
MRVLVIGGTGVVGRPTALELIRRGHSVAVLSRRGNGAPPGAEAFTGDITTDAGLKRALVGVDCVVDCANVTTTSRKVAVDYFTDTTRRLGRLGRAAGVSHHVVVSIVGIDDVPYGYYEGKVAQERAALAGPVPASVLRATQFHEFAGQMLNRVRLGPLSLVPDMLVQPIAAAEVAVALADVVEAGPAGRVPDVAGPRQEWLPDLARRLVRHTGQRRAVVSVR